MSRKPMALVIMVVRNVSLTVPRGKFVCFLGPSGCGKTTLMRMVAGLETPTSGRIFMNDKDITDTPVHRRNFAMVFQALALFLFLTVEDNIAYAMEAQECRPPPTGAPACASCWS